ncbi:hypothetical protein K438DRAFT_1765760 [Mycena galopus ATCC 62051]|nr:hypothetical protein K438DRAFT_1765760 [Mycena galopus ATCC 62051]
MRTVVRPIKTESLTESRSQSFEYARATEVELRQGPEFVQGIGNGSQHELSIGVATSPSPPPSPTGPQTRKSGRGGKKKRNFSSQTLRCVIVVTKFKTTKKRTLLQYNASVLGARLVGFVFKFPRLEVPCLFKKADSNGMSCSLQLITEKCGVGIPPVTNRLPTTDKYKLSLNWA